MSLLADPAQPEPVNAAELLAFTIGYLHLFANALDARAVRRQPRDRPVALAQLRGYGLDDGIFLWMLYQAHVEHLDRAPARENGCPAGALARVLLHETSMLALTEAGEAFADLFLAAVLRLAREKSDEAWDLIRTGQLVPHYNRQLRIFSWGRQRLKQFRQPSINQEIVLCSAEELAWPAWFDDPLPRGHPANPKVRLHDTIKNLNRHQEPYLIHFRGDGTGTRIGWQLPVTWLESNGRGVRANAGH